MMTFLKLLKRLVLRTIKEERFLTMLSVLGVALGIGLFMGVNIASNRAIASFEENISGINPAFTYEVVNISGIDFSEDVYKPVKAIEEKSVPVLAVNAYIPDTNETVNINGIYTVQALAFNVLSAKGNVDVEDFFKDLSGVLITKKFGDSHQLKKGDVLTAYVYNREYRLKVIDILDDHLLPANTVFMDLGNFQEYFGRIGYVTRIDIATDEKGAGEVRAVLPAGLTIEKKEKVLQNQKSLVDAFRLNLRFVTFLAVLVGVFLLYNTIFISVIKRRTEIGVLRGLGMNRKTVAALFSVQGIILGFAGSILGIAFGQLFAWFSIVAVEKTITQFYRSAVVSDYFITGKDALWTVALGLIVSFLASLLPALESAHVRPNESSREGALERAYKTRQKILSFTGAVLILFSVLIIYIDYRFVPFKFPWLSYAGIVSFILGCTLNAPAYLQAVLKVLRKQILKLFKASGHIAVGDMRGSSYRFSLALMSVAVSSALIVAIMSSVYSLKTSFSQWINTYIAADVYIKPASCTSNFCFYPLADETVRNVGLLPGVMAIERFRALQLDFRGQKVIAGFGDADLLWKYRPNISQEEKTRLKRLALHREILLSDYLRVTYGLKRGDTVELQTPKGNVAFTINSTSISYSTMSGFIFMDRRWLKEYWGLDDTTSIGVYLGKGEDAGTFIRQLKQSISEKYALSIMDNRELRQAVLRVFDKSFAITYTIEIIAIAISLIGVVNALLILVFEKKRDISILRYLGAGWQDIRKVMVLSAGIIGIAGIGLGCVMGSAISIVITHVINKISFGWEVSFRSPFLPISLLMVLLFLATLLAGLVPFYLARKINPKAFISFE